MKLQKHALVEIIEAKFFQFNGKVVTQKKWKPKHSGDRAMLFKIHRS